MMNDSWNQSAHPCHTYSERTATAVAALPRNPVYYTTLNSGGLLVDPEWDLMISQIYDRICQEEMEL